MTAIIQPLYAKSCSIGNNHILYKFENVEKKIGIALLIGNSRYHSGTLKYPVKDAISIASILNRIGFAVARFENFKNKSEFNGVTRQFNKCLKISKYFVALFYFSGHGAYIKEQSANFLIPIDDSDIQDRADVEIDSFSVKKLFLRLKEADNKLNIVILDACRKHPYLIFSKGLGKMPRFYHVIVAYPTKYGKTIEPTSSSSRREKNSLYVKHFLKELELAYKNGIEVKDFLDKVHKRVMKESKKRQYPIVRPLRKVFFCWKKTCPKNSLDELDDELSREVDDGENDEQEAKKVTRRSYKGLRGGH